MKNVKFVTSQHVCHECYPSRAMSGHTEPKGIVGMVLGSGCSSPGISMTEYRRLKAYSIVAGRLAMYLATSGVPLERLAAAAACH